MVASVSSYRLHTLTQPPWHGAGDFSFVTAVDAPVAPETTTVRCIASSDYRFGISQFLLEGS